MKHATLILLLWVVSPAAAFASVGDAPFRLSPRQVVDRILHASSEAREIELQGQRADIAVLRSRAALDWKLSTSVSHDFNRLEYLSGYANPEDRMTSWNLGIAKKLPSGTSLGLDYSRVLDSSVLNPLVTSIRPANLVQDLVGASLRQDLLGNFFGISDREKIAEAEIGRDRAALNRMESLENLAVQAVRQYWNVYLAQERLRETIASRDKYRQLVSTVDGKARTGLADEAEVAKARASFSNAEQAVKSASLAYLTAIDQLFLALRLPAPEKLELESAEKLPLPPAEKDGTVAAEKLRTVRAATLALEASEKQLRIARSLALPELALYAKAWTGGIEPTGSASFSEMAGGTHPRFVIGAELVLRPWSDANQAERAQAELSHDEALNRRTQALERETERLNRTARDARAKYVIAVEARETAAQWQKAVREQERKFRKGRIGTSELTQDYDALLRTESAKAAAVAEYYYSLHEWEAARDRLLAAAEGQEKTP